MQESINIFRRPTTTSHNVQPDNPSRQSNNPNPTLWIFGYGSLCWYPGFEYNKCVTGYIRGYSRRFWQGNTTHRGTPEKVNYQKWQQKKIVFLPKLFLKIQ
jgi:hypothetical protein